MDDSRTTDGSVLSWQNDAVTDYRSVEKYLPVAEESLIPVRAGSFRPAVSIAATRDVALLRTQIGVASVGVTVLDPAHVAFLVPGATSGDCYVNGRLARAGFVHLPGSENEFYIRGAGRDMLGIAVRRDLFLETVAALRGADPEEVGRGARLLELTPSAASSLHGRLARVLELSARHSARELENAVLGLLVETYVSAHPGRTTHAGGRLPRFGHIVRRAEERFEAAGGGTISLADLCSAAGVGKSSLYRAFHTLCGEPPLSYFRKRGLVTARSLLLRSAPERGAVKRAALQVGMTELGRFSAEYRRLFGELPSVTLNRDAG